MRKLLILTVLLQVCSFCYSEEMDPDLFSPKGIPAIYIDLEDGVSIGEIQRDVKIRAAMRIENTDYSVYDQSELYDSYIEIRGRGNSTWGFEKKPYNIDLINAEGDDNEAGLLGMPKNAEWALIANYADKSMLRIPLAYKLGELIGMEYSPRTRFVEVYINGAYNGLYSLCEKIGRDKNRVNVSKLDSSYPGDTGGGYILEVDFPGRIDPEDNSFETNIANVSMVIKYPKAKNISEEQIHWIEDYINEMEATLYGENFQDPITGFRKYIDVESTINWYLINELGKNVDAHMRASVFFYKDKNGKLKTGPLWDFDLAFANNNDDPVVMREDGLYIAQAVWFNRFLSDEDFKSRVRERYDELSSLFYRIPQILDKNARQLIESGAIQRNFERWDILGKKVWWADVEPYPKTYDGEVRRLVDWIKARNSWMNVNLLTSEAEFCEKLTNEVIPIRPYDTDKFFEGEATKIRAVRGYNKYTWSNGVQTDSYELEIQEGGEYYVSVERNGFNCTNLMSEPLVFIAKGKINYTNENLVFEYNGNPVTKEFTTMPSNLETAVLYVPKSNQDQILNEITVPGVYTMKTSIVEPYYKGKDSIDIKIVGAVIVEEELILTPNEDYQLNYAIETGDENVGSVWSSSSEDVAIVDDAGRITAKAIGNTHITLRSDNGAYVATCLVTVDTNTEINQQAIDDVEIRAIGKNILIKFPKDSGYTVTVTEMTGKILSVTQPANAYHRISMDKHASGVYVVTVEDLKTKQSKIVVIN